MAAQLIIHKGPTLSDSISGDATVCAEDIKTYSTSGSYGATSYNWSVPNDATILSGQGTNSVLVLFGSSDGNITVSASNSCDTTEELILPINMNCRKSISSIDSSSSVEIYPNPTDGIITLKFLALKDDLFRINIVDASSRILFNLIENSYKGINYKTINLCHIEPGIYFLRFKSEYRDHLFKVIIY